MSVGLYIHIPFCNKKCLYCDFYSAGLRIADWELYVDSLCNELDERKNELSSSPSTLYLGGGTPSLMPLKNFKELATRINGAFKKEDWDEFTIEVNPEDVSEQNCMVWKDCGVNRVSVGLQSMNDKELKMIGRCHDSLTSIRAYHTLTRYFDNISVDLMFGLPGQTPESYQASLQRILDLHPVHISSYSLMLEEGTSMTLLANKGKIILPGEDEWMEMFKMTYRELREAGYLHYETSNYALPGYESIHNTGYWKGIPYLGLGPGAHSYDGECTRRNNPADIKGYLRHFRNPSNTNFYQEEILTEEELREEMIMTRLRMKEGLDLSVFSRKYGESETLSLLENASHHISKGLMKKESGRLMITEEGIPLSNEILSDLF